MPEQDPKHREQSARDAEDDAIERLFAGENLRLFAMFLMGLSVGILLTLLYVDVISP